MRRDIDTRPRRLKDVLLDDGLRKEFLGGVAKNDAKAVKTFVSNNSENALKTRPKVRSITLLLMFYRVLYVVASRSVPYCGMATVGARFVARGSWP